MPFSDEEYVDIMRHLQRRLQEYAPGIFEHLSMIRDIPGSPRERLIQYFQYAIEMLKEQSSSSYPDILGLLNRYIRTRGEEEIDGIEIVFTQAEKEVYGVGEIDLGSLPDLQGLIDRLQSILDAIINDTLDNRETR